MKIHMDHDYATFIPLKHGQGNRLCHQDKLFDKNVTSDYFEVTCSKCLKIYDDAQEEAEMEGERRAS